MKEVWLSAFRESLTARGVFQDSFCLTTEHSASSYGQPVLVDTETGIAYGIGDILPDGRLAAEVYADLGAEAYRVEQAHEFLKENGQGLNPLPGGDRPPQALLRPSVSRPGFFCMRGERKGCMVAY